MSRGAQRRRSRITTRYGGRLARLLCGMLAAITLAACAVPGNYPTLEGNHAVQQSLRLARTDEDLAKLERVDLLLDLDSDRLARELRVRLADALGDVPGWSGSDLTVTFARGYIALDLQGRYEIDEGAPAPVAVFGELIPAFHPDRLAWRIELAGLATNEPMADTRLVLDRLQNDLAAALATRDPGAFALDPLPLGILEAGIRLRSPFDIVRSESRALSGVLIPEQTAALVDSDRTVLALQLGFVPELPYCEPTVGIGRATFAGNIERREPRQPRTTQGRPGDARVFFSEITGARKATTVVHYWFADGQPVAVSPLGVEPSARWRTWSGAPTDVGDVSRWQVLVLEERSGCILAHDTLEVADAHEMDPAAEAPDFDGLARRFRERTSPLRVESAADLPAVVTVNRRFLGSALGEAMYDLSLGARLAVTRANPLPVNVRIGAQPGDALSCSRPSCESQRVCTLDFERCPVQRDTRDCTSCLLRNPLNNRCIRESEDPICLAAREGENQRLDEERQACIERETAQRDRCIRERDRVLGNCRRQQTMESSVCEAQVAEMKERFETLQPLATLNGNLNLAGTLDFVFSEFRMDPDLERVRMSISLVGDLDTRGTLRFSPTDSLETLGRCFRPRDEDYRAPLTLAPWRGGIITDLQIEQSRLVADWSGLIQRISTDPSPASQFFVTGEAVLGTCPSGLDPTRLLDNISGPGSDWLRGVFELDMHPEPTRISLLPAYLTLGNGTWTGEAEIGPERVTYRIENRD